MAYIAKIRLASCAAVLCMLGYRYAKLQCHLLGDIVLAALLCSSVLDLNRPYGPRASCKATAMQQPSQRPKALRKGLKECREQLIASSCLMGDQ